MLWGLRYDPSDHIQTLVVSAGQLQFPNKPKVFLPSSVFTRHWYSCGHNIYINNHILIFYFLFYHKWGVCGDAFWGQYKLRAVHSWSNHLLRQMLMSGLNRAHCPYHHYYFWSLKKKERPAALSNQLQGQRRWKLKIKIHAVYFEYRRHTHNQFKYLHWGEEKLPDLVSWSFQKLSVLKCISCNLLSISDSSLV